MKEHILTLVSSILAGMVVMIFHELPKSILYNVQTKNQSAKVKRNIYKVIHYIDPIGLILFVTSGVGFSKPYMYRIKEKKTNFILGVTGFVSLLVLFGISMVLFKVFYLEGAAISYTTDVEFFLKAFPLYFIKNLGLFSINMFIVNLIPVSTFDLGLIVAGKSPSKYFSIIQNDYIIKMVFLFVILFNIIPSIGMLVANGVLMF